MSRKSKPEWKIPKGRPKKFAQMHRVSLNLDTASYRWCQAQENMSESFRKMIHGRLADDRASRHRIFLVTGEPIEQPALIEHGIRYVRDESTWAFTGWWNEKTLRPVSRLAMCEILGVLPRDLLEWEHLIESMEFSD